MAQSRPMQLQAGRAYRVRIEARETYGEAQLQLVWSYPSGTLQADAVKAAQQADAVVMFLGLTPRTSRARRCRCRSQGSAAATGTSLDLPAVQQRLLESVIAVGKPTVLVLMNGSALAVNWAQANVPGIIEAWYPGQAGGSAIADVLFGDYNPAGRLPVTFYKDAKRPPTIRGLRDGGPHVPLLRRHAALSIRPWAELHHVRVQEPAHERRERTPRPASVTVSRRRDEHRDRAPATRSCSSTRQHMGSKVPRARKELRGYRARDAAARRD